MSLPKNEKKTVFVAFHSYGAKPCTDGLFSLIFALKLYAQDTDNVCLLPYMRTPRCAKKLKEVFASKSTEFNEVIYVDCSPEIEEEVSFLEEIQRMEGKETLVRVFDHHPLKEDSPFLRLLENPKLEQYTSENMCATMIMYDRLSCLLYTSPSPRDGLLSRMPSSA